MLPRQAQTPLADALADTRVVLVNGPRQCGKSTLVRQVGVARGATCLTFDNEETRQAAQFDPTEFVRREGLLIIDEVQRVPNILLAIKENVDADPRPGRFLLTGSARVLGLSGVPDALPGRMETIELWPLSQGEIDKTPDAFVDAIFAGGPNLQHRSSLTRADYLERLVRGGFPESVTRQGRRRDRFLDSYVDSLIQRDVLDIADVQRLPQLRALVRLLAARSGQSLIAARMADDLALPQSTITRYLALLEGVFLIRRIPAWSTNIGTRAVSTPKVAFVDSGVAANTLGLDPAGLSQPNSPLGGLLEGFVAMEIARQLTWSTQRADLFHYRTRDQVEVDIVLENRQGEVVGIEIKASSSVTASDFSGLKHLDARLHDRLKVGLVLYTGTQTLPFGPKFRAMPISALWQVGRPTSS